VLNTLVGFQQVFLGFGTNNLFFDHEFLNDTRGFEEKGNCFKATSCFGVDGVNIFRGLRSRVIVWIQCQNVPNVIGVH
jgi:hypothetical protein